MTKGFTRIAVASPVLHLGAPEENVKEHLELARRAVAEGVSVLAFPELSLTGYTCGDLFFRSDFLDRARAALDSFARQTAELPLVSIVGLPYAEGPSIYNVAAVVSGGIVRGLVPKTYLPTYGEYYDLRQFTPGTVSHPSAPIPFGTRLVFAAGDIKFSVELCEDLWAAVPPSSTLAGTDIDCVFNLSASTEFLGKAEKRRERVRHQSAALGCVYAMASSGIGESSSDAVFGGQSLIAVNGRVVREGALFSETSDLVSETVDFDALAFRRRSMTSLNESNFATIEVIDVSAASASPALSPDGISRTPFLDEYGEEGWTEKLLTIQGVALARRMRAAHSKALVIGVSGGADSALALLGAKRAAERVPGSRLIALVMPAFASSERTQSRAADLAKAVGAEVRVVNICAACRQHLADIGHDEATHDLAFENVQARERTQVLMDVANMAGGLVVGTGDLSEIALGWNTYNGDHMSMYQINASIPKTMVLAALENVAKTAEEPLRSLLDEIAHAPITPELVPNAAGNDSEARLGPYELHDFFLYHFLANGASREKILALALAAFRGKYDAATVERTRDTFWRRFQASQYKRNCVPDGPKITLSLSPRADWRMPSDLQFL